MKRSLVYSIILILIATAAVASSFTIHDFGTGVMHDAKDIYRTNARSVENDIASNEVRIAGLQTKADSTENALEIDKANLAANYDTTATVNGKLSLKANSADVYSKSAADALLNAKLDAVTINGYYLKTQTYNTTEIAALLAAKPNTADVYNKSEINLLLSDYETTGAVALHIANKGAHSFPDPTGQPVNRLPVTNGAGGWDYTSFGAAGAGVTNAVDLIVASPAADALSSHNQQAFDDTMIVELKKIWTIDGSQDVALYYRKVQADSADVALYYRKVQADSADVALYERKVQADSADVAIGNRTTAANVNVIVAAATAECQAKTWTPLSMANGDYTGEVIIDTVAASQTVYNVVYSSSTGWAAAKADTDSTLPALGMALEAGTGDKKILLRGIVKNTSWNFTKGNLIYVSTATAGAITAVKPSTTGNRVQIVGVAVSSNIVYFFFDSTYVEI